jgi:hypothetical protein
MYNMRDETTCTYMYMYMYVGTCMSQKCRGAHAQGRGGQNSTVQAIPAIQCTAHIIRGEPKRTPNTRESGRGVYLYNYLFVSDLAQQRLNAHAQTPRAYRDCHQRSRRSESQRGGGVPRLTQKPRIKYNTMITNKPPPGVQLMASARPA